MFSDSLSDSLCAAPDAEARAGWNRALSSFPQISRTVLGRSILGREIDLFRAGEGGERFLLVGTHHAMEHITTALLYAFLFAAAEDRSRDTAICLQRFTFFVVPCLNPDGVELLLHPDRSEGNPLYRRAVRMNGGSDFSRWQANARGVDLNHNYKEGFAAYKVLEREGGILPGRTRYCGEYPESEPETAALAALVRAVDFSAVVSLHTQGEEVYAFPDSPRARLFGVRAARILGYRLARPEGLASYGGLCDYTGAIGIPSLTVECGIGRGGKNPVPPENCPALARKVVPALFRIALALPRK